MKIAVVGSGIAGLMACHLLNKEHEITLFEKEDYVGGHVHTHQLSWGEKPQQQCCVDTGFIVHNDRNYPHFVALLEELGVQTQNSVMSFSVMSPEHRLEYAGTNLNTVFSQRKNLFNAKFWRMLQDILRFNRHALSWLEQTQHELTLGEYLERFQFNEWFKRFYILPMGSAIWSTSIQDMYAFPARFFIRFFANHGLLTVNDQPQWKVIEGGSFAYVKKMIKPFESQIRLKTPVEQITREGDSIQIHTKDYSETFDKVVLACHSQQALSMLKDPSDWEERVLSKIPYQPNEAVLHFDETLLPKNKRAWASWNYLLDPDREQHAVLTYHMNRLQNLDIDRELCVTLNATHLIEPSKIIKTLHYEHPLFTVEGEWAKSQHHIINGHKNTYYCGAWWANGFHEDGVVSAKNAVKALVSQTHA
ncbi:MAG: FAD-dependent oxidoreductase [Betaproteobacteria bacterium]|nr:FAD-dependent oxidoreductase [Betaproteobacteria bacterium]